LAGSSATTCVFVALTTVSETPDNLTVGVVPKSAPKMTS
jgi:hypothetical protein